MTSRRDFLKTTSLAGASLFLPMGLWSQRSYAAPPYIPPVSPVLTKYLDQLPIPGSKTPTLNAGTGFYELALTMANSSHSFHSELGTAQTFGYGGASYLGPTIIATRGQPIKATMTNSLGEHPLGAMATPNPLNVMGVQPQDAAAPRVAVHLHGSYVAQESDGGPLEYFPRNSAPFDTNTFTYTWPNDQQAATLWYHDHAFGLTRANVYAGLAAYYLLRDEFDTGLAGNPIGLPAPYGTYELPLVLQDKSFNTDGTLFYALDSGWIPEFFGDVAVINGKAWPYLNVEQAVYRFRIINGSQARFYNLSLSKGVPIYQIGTDSGLLDAPVRMNTLLIGPGERADILMDFTKMKVGTTLILKNNAPTPFPGGKRTNRAGGAELPELMKFTVTAVAGTGATTSIPASLRGGTGQPPLLTRLSAHTASVAKQRYLVLFEVMGPAGPIAATINALTFEESLAGPNAITTAGGGAVQKDSLEQWNIINLTGDTHPMHVHLANFQILDRQNLNATQYMNAMTANGTRIWQSVMADDLGVLAPVPDTTLYAVPDPAPYLIGSAIPPAANEMGWKDTIHIPPGQVTRLLVPFGNDALGTAGTTGTDDIPFGRLVTEGAGIAYGSFGGSFTGTYVWHCHILDHEENDMMNFYQIV